MKKTLGADNTVVELKYKDGTKAMVGDVIRWNCFDTDDFNTWTMTGIVKNDCVIYLGGGIDFGSGIGKIFLSFGETINESENNDAELAGIEKLGTVSELADHIMCFGSE